MNRRSVLLSAAASATTGALGVATMSQPALAKIPPGLIGTWRISDEIGRPVGETGLMRIDPNGRIIIALSGRLADGVTTASISPDEAVRLYRGTLVMAGTFQAPPLVADRNGLTKVDVIVEETNVPGNDQHALPAGLQGPRRRTDLDRDRRGRPLTARSHLVALVTPSAPTGFPPAHRLGGRARRRPSTTAISANTTGAEIPRRHLLGEAP